MFDWRSPPVTATMLLLHRRLLPHGVLSKRHCCIVDCAGSFPHVSRLNSVGVKTIPRNECENQILELQNNTLKILLL